MEVFDEVIERVKREHKELIELTLKRCHDDIKALVSLTYSTFIAGGRLFVFGNGGSATDALHLEAELVGKLGELSFQFPAISLVDRPGVITSISNDFGYENVFSKQLEALGRKGDIVIAITTSGRSVNCLRALETAKTIGMKTAILTGKNGESLRGKADIIILVQSSDTQRIQEAHIVIIHIFCETIKRIGDERAKRS
ncbi:MAG: D-sedoheptulose-7-phosphate isomerase [bacterium]